MNQSINQTVAELCADRDSVLHAIAKTPAVTNSRVLYVLVETLASSSIHFIALAESRGRELTEYEKGHVDALTVTLKSIATDLGIQKMGQE